MRLFIGSFAKLDSYESLKQEFSALKLTWVKEENLHLTYAFFPDEQDAKLLLEGLKELPLEHKALEIKGMSTFGEKILYAKVDDETVHKNYKLIHEKFSGEIKRFDPHVTLARIKTQESTLIQQALSQVKSKHLGTLCLEILLIQSTLTPQGSIYKVLSSLK